MSRTLPICVSAGIDTNINIYDLNKLEIRSKVVPSEYGGYTKIQFSNFDPNILYTASTLGDFSLIDVRDSKIVKTFKGNAAAINDFVEVRE
jgi:WD40 repeat protein